MPQPEQLLLTYLHLARASQVRRQMFVRDKFLVLSGVTASQLGWSDIAASCRERVLLHNPRHLIRRWSDLERAGHAERFDTYLKQLRRKYSPEKAEHMLQSLGIPLRLPADELRDSRGRATLLVAALSKESSRPRSDRPDGEPAQAVRSTAGSHSEGSAPAVADPRAATSRWWPYWCGLVALALLAILRAMRGAGE
jgi:hypothetical protein